MTRKLAAATVAVLAVAGCSAGESKTAGAPATSAATAAAVPTTAATTSEPATDPGYPEDPKARANVLRKLKAQGFRVVTLPNDVASLGINLDVCPYTVWVNVIPLKDAVHLYITPNGIDFLDVTSPPTRKQLDDYGLCPALT